MLNFATDILSLLILLRLFLLNTEISTIWLAYGKPPYHMDVLPFSRRNNYKDKFWFDIIIWWWMFPDYHFISGFDSVYIQFTQKQNKFTEYSPDWRVDSQQELRID